MYLQNMNNTVGLAHLADPLPPVKYIRVKIIIVLNF